MLRNWELHLADDCSAGVRFGNLGNTHVKGTHSIMSAFKAVSLVQPLAHVHGL